MLKSLNIVFICYFPVLYFVILINQSTKLNFNLIDYFISPYFFFTKITQSTNFTNFKHNFYINFQLIKNLILLS